MRAILTPDDLKKGDLVDPGWYACKISDYEEKEAATDKSTNCILTFKVESTLDGKPTKFAGCVGNKLFNEKSLGFGKKLFEVMGVEKTAEGGYDISTETFTNMLDSHVGVYFERGKSNKGNEFNDPKDFRKIA